MTAQPDTVQRTREERFRWDEENRLTALSQNGYVSHYWNDGNWYYHIKDQWCEPKDCRDGTPVPSAQ